MRTSLSLSPPTIKQATSRPASLLVHCHERISVPASDKRKAGTRVNRLFLLPPLPPLLHKQRIGRFFVLTSLHLTFSCSLYSHSSSSLLFFCSQAQENVIQRVNTLFFFTSTPSSPSCPLSFLQKDDPCPSIAFAPPQHSNCFLMIKTVLSPTI